MGIALKEEYLLADVSPMMSSELRCHCNHYFIFKSCLHDVFPQLPVQPSTECTRTDTLNSNPFLIFHGTCHKTQSQTNGHLSINCNIRRRKPLPTSILLLRLVPSPPLSVLSLSSISGVSRRFHIPIHEEKAYRLTLKACWIYWPTKPLWKTYPNHWPPHHLRL